MPADVAVTTTTTTTTTFNYVITFKFASACCFSCILSSCLRRWFLSSWLAFITASQPSFPNKKTQHTPAHGPPTSCSQACACTVTSHTMNEGVTGRARGHLSCMISICFCSSAFWLWRSEEMSEVRRKRRCGVVEGEGEGKRRKRGGSEPGGASQLLFQFKIFFVSVVFAFITACASASAASAAEASQS